MTNKPDPIPITPLMPTAQARNDDGQRDFSQINTMELFKDAKETAQEDPRGAFDADLWKHLEGRLKYLLHMAGMR